MVLRRLRYWLGYSLIATALHGQSFNRSLISIRPETTQSPVGQLRFYEATTPTNYVGFKAPASIAANIIWQLPAADGSAGNCIGWSSAAVLDWVTCAGGGGSGITSLNTLTSATQTFVNDTNVTIVSSGTQHTITWASTLSKARQFGATAYTDAANTWSTGAQSFAAATSLIVPAAAGAAPTASGSIMYDSTANTWEGGVNGANKTFLFTDGNAATATALAANPTDCPGGEFANAIAANGNLTCSAPAGGGNVNVTGATTSGNVVIWNSTGGSVDNVGVDYDTAATNNTIVQRTSDGSIAGFTGSFQTLVIGPATDVVTAFFRRGAAGATDIVKFQTQVGGDLTSFDNSGNFTGRAATATALASDPAACPGGQFVTDVAANGTLTCAVASSGFVSGPGSSTIGFVPRWNNTAGTQIDGGYPVQTTTPTATALIGTDSLKGFKAYDKGGTVFHCSGYGVVADGTTDDLAAMQACRDALPTTGGVMQAPCGDIALSDALELGNGTVGGTASTRHGITLRGCGKGELTNASGGSAAYTGATRFKSISTTGLSEVTITGITNATPIVVTATSHGLETQDLATIDQAGRNGSCSNDNAANGTWTVRKIDANNVELRGSVGNGTFFSTGCTPKLYKSKPVIRVAGPITNVHLENIQVDGAVANSGGITGTLVTTGTTGSGVGIEWRHVTSGGMRNVGVNGFVLAIDMRTSNTTNASVNYFNCNSLIQHIVIGTPAHQRASGMRWSGYDIAAVYPEGGADTCSNKIDDLKIMFGMGIGSYAVEEGYSDNNVIRHGQFGGPGGTSGGKDWRRVQPINYVNMPAANRCDMCFSNSALVENQSEGRNLWLPNFGETELEGSLDDMVANLPFTNLNVRGFTDRGRFFNTYMQARDGAVTSPAYSFSADVNTGMYRVGADDIGFATGGVLRAKIGTAVESKGSLAGFLNDDRTTGASKAWEWYADGGSERLYSFLKGWDVLSIADTGTTTWQSQETGGFNVFLREYGNAATTDRAGLHIYRAGGTIASPSDVTAGMRLGTFTMAGRVNAVDLFAVRIDGYADAVSSPNATSSLRFATAENAAFPTDVFKMNAYGGLEFQRGRTKSDLDTLASGGFTPNGSIWFCSDCTHGSSTCAASSTGAIAKRLNGAWACD
jgi:hypothetical protein